MSHGIYKRRFLYGVTWYIRYCANSEEINEALDEDDWGPGRRDPAVQASVDSFFAVGYPRGPRPGPPDDRPVRDRLPYPRRLWPRSV